MQELHTAKPAGRTLWDALKAYDAKTDTDKSLTGIEKERRRRISRRLHAYDCVRLDTIKRRGERRLAIVAGTDYYGPEDKLDDIAGAHQWRHDGRGFNSSL